MQKHHGDSEADRGEGSAKTAVSPIRFVALVFGLSVTLPIVWALTASTASAQQRAESQPAPLAAKPSRGGRKAPVPPPVVEPPAPKSVEVPKAAQPDVAPIVDRRRALQHALLAQAASALLQQSAAAPNLSAVGASSSRSALSATASAKAAAQQTESTDSANVPVAPTQRDVQAVRASQSQALVRTADQATRRRAAMHRMAAAAASSLNDATPFRTTGSGPSRFSGTSGGDTIGSGLDRAAAVVSVVPGLRLEDVSLSAGFSSNGLPRAQGFWSNQSGSLGSDADFGAKATLAFRKSFRTSSFGLTYTPSRNQRTRFSEWNSTDHVVGLEFDRDLGRRWGLKVDASGANTGMEQFWFRQPIYRRIENPPTSFEELVRRVDAGEFTDDEVASLLTGAPIVDDPGGRELRLGRVTSLNSTATATYAHSARTSLMMGIGANEYQSSRGEDFRDASGRIAVNNISRQFAFLQGSYRMSPSLTVGLKYNANRNDSNFGLSYANSASVFVQRRLNRFWSVQGEGGGGYVSLDANPVMFKSFPEAKLDARPTWLAGGSVRYRYSGHAFETFAKRQVGDALGLPSRSSLTAGMSWEWATPRMPWVVSAGASFSKSDFGYTILGGGSNFYETSLLQGGLSRRLSPTSALMLGYYYGKYESPFSGLLTGTTIHRVQGTFLWRPVEVR